MSTPEGPGQPRPGEQWPPPPPPYGAPQYEPVIYQQPPRPDQLPPGQGGPYYASPYGGYPQTAPPNRPPNRLPLIIVTVAVVVVALAVVGIVVLTKGDDKDKVAQTTPASGSRSATASTAAASASGPAAPVSPTGSLSPTTVPQITVPSVIPGWHGVLSYRDNIAYDVPPDWKVETPGTVVGFEGSSGQPVAIIHGVSTYKDDACPGVSGSYRGHTGFQSTGNVDPTTAAVAGLKIFTDGVALKDDGTSAPVSRTTLANITVAQGKIRARYARATVTLNDKSDCGSPSVVVVAVAFRSGPASTALFIGYFDQGVSDALALSTATKIFTTLRPYRR